MMFLQVTNRGKEQFASKFNGVEYVFAPKVPITIGMDAAQHIFAVGLVDKTEILTRHGWLTHSSARQEAIDKLNSFAFDIPNDNPEPETEPVLLEEYKEQGSAPLQLGADAEAKLPDGDEAEVSVPISQGGILNNLKGIVSAAIRR